MVYNHGFFSQTVSNSFFSFRLMWLLIVILSLSNSFSQVGSLNFPREFRGVWITTAYNLDWPSSNKLSIEDQKADFIRYLDKIDSTNMNAVIVQVRAAADAFYDSPYEPWSFWLTGEQGRDPRYDPLEFMISECHKRNIF